MSTSVLSPNQSNLCESLDSQSPVLREYDNGIHSHSPARSEGPVAFWSSENVQVLPNLESTTDTSENLIRVEEPSN